MESESSKTIGELRIYFDKFSQIFGYPSVTQAFLKHLKDIAVPSNEICAKRLDNVGYWNCKECQRYSIGIICHQCYEKSKDKHKDHHLSLGYCSEGSCDCGNPDYWDPKGACSDHNGPLESKEKIEKYLTKSLPGNQREQVCSMIDLICQRTSTYFVLHDKERLTTNYKEILTMFLEFIFRICRDNPALLHIIADYLCKNYPNTINHDCLVFGDNDSFELKKFKNKEHECECPFITRLILIWKDKICDENLLYLFLRVVKLKTYFGVTCYHFLRHIKKQTPDLCDFSLHLVSDHVALLISNSDDAIENIFEQMIECLKEAFKTNDFKECQSFFQKQYYRFNNLFKVNSAKIICNKLKVYEKLIILFEMLQYGNSCYYTTISMPDGYNSHLTDIEFYLLCSILSFVSLLDITNEELVNSIFLCFSKAINKSIKKEYSFHIPLERAFSIFIVHYLYEMTQYKKCDLDQAMQYLIQSIPNYFKLCEIMIKNFLMNFGFNLGILKNIWIYYGENMTNYPYLFFHNLYLYCNCSLLKIMLFSPENANFFHLDKLITYASVNDSHKMFIETLFNKKENLYLTEDDKNKYFPLNAEIIKLIIAIIRSNKLIFRLYVMNADDLDERSLTPDTMTNLMESEKEVWKIINRQEIFHFILRKENNTSYSEIQQTFPVFMKHAMSEKEFEDLIMEMTNKSSQANLSVKNDCLKEFDNSSYLNPYFLKIVDKYLLEFKKEVINLLNTVPFKYTQVKRNFELTCIKNFFFNPVNIEMFFNGVDMVLNSKLHSSLLSVLSPLFLKIVCLYPCFFKEFPELEEYKLEIIERLNRVLPYLEENKDISDLLAYCEYTKLTINQFISPSIVTDSENVDKDKKNGKQKLLLKYKNKFKKQNEKIESKYDINNLIPDKDNGNEKDFCVVCRNELDSQNFINDHYGKVAMIVNDILIHTTEQRIMRDEYYENMSNSKNKIKFRQFLKELSKEKQQKDKFTFRIVSCNHRLHEKCLNQPTTYNPIIGCSLCKLQYNTYVPDLTNCEDKKVRVYLQGYEMKDLITFDSKGNMKINMNKSIIESTLNEKMKIILDKVTTFIEDIINQNQTRSTIETIAKNPMLFQEIYCNKLLKGFSLWLKLIQFNEVDVTQIEMMKNYILSLRFIIKQKKLNQLMFISKLFMSISGLLKFYNDRDPIFSLIENNNFEKWYTELLFLMLLFLNTNEIKSIKDSINRLFFPYLIVEIYLLFIFKSNRFHLHTSYLTDQFKEEKIQKFISETLLNKDSKQYRIIYNIFQQYEICIQLSQLFDNSTISNFYSILPKSDLSLENFLEDTTFYKKNFSPKMILNSIINKVYIEINKSKLNNIYIKRSLFVMGFEYKVKFIHLPETLLQLDEYYEKKKCFNCKKSYFKSLICLLCGKKFCNDKSCLSMDKKMSSLNHMELSGGNIVFISNTKGTIFYLVSHRITSDSDSGYLNQFGNEPLDSAISDEFKINKQELDSALKKFINCSKRDFFKNAKPSIVKEPVTETDFDDL